jgi:hypothetical protein
MMLDRHDIDAEVVAIEMLVEAFLEKLRRDLRVAIFVRQARADRVRRIEHVLRHKRIGILAMVPSLHF